MVRFRRNPESLSIHSDRNKRTILAGALNPEFKRPVDPSEVPHLVKKLRQMQSQLNEFTPIENSLVSRALGALRDGRLDEPILQRYLDE